MVADGFNKNATEEKTEPRLTGSDAQVYSILTSNLKNAAYEHGLMDTDFYDRLSEVNLYAPSVRDVALINSEFRRVFANTDDARIVSWLNGLGNLQARLTSINEQNMPVSTENTPVNEDVTNIDVYMAEGEILSLKHTKNVYSLFKGADRVMVGKDIISDGFVAIPLTGTGGLTGALVASVLNVKPKRASWIIMLGILTAGLITSLVTYVIPSFFI